MCKEKIKRVKVKFAFYPKDLAVNDDDPVSWIVRDKDANEIFIHSNFKSRLMSLSHKGNE